MSDHSTPNALESGSHENHPVKLGYSPVADIEHKLRLTDTDPKAARRAERQVASMFVLSILLVFAFVIAGTVYVILDLEYPRQGFIRVDNGDRVLVELLQGMK